MATENKIEAKEIQIKKLFSDDFIFEIPEFQRPFSWNSEKFLQLIDDLNDALTNNEKQYFLGSIILQKSKERHYKLIDGQQRITALTILMAVIRDISKDREIQETLQNKIYQKENSIENTPEEMRLIPWEDLKDLFKEFIYIKNGTMQIYNQNLTNQDTPKFHIHEAVKVFREKLLDFDEDELKKFTQFLLNDVYLVYIKTPDLMSAFRLFNVLNARGLPLTTSDLLKSENLGAIKDEIQRKQYSEIWRKIEEDLGREELENVIGFIRTIKLKEKAKLNIYEEYEKNIFKNELIKKGPEFIDYLEKISYIYNDKVLSGEIETNKQYDKNKYKAIVRLMKEYIPFSDWIPPLIYFYHKFRNDGQMLNFLLKLEKKVIVEWTAGFSFTERLTSLNRILKLIEKSKTAEEVVSTLLTYKEEEKRGKKSRYIEYNNQEELKKIIENILDDVQFYQKYGGKFAKYILLRIDIEKSELENISKEYTGLITVEHILPQNPPLNSEWVKLFNDEQRTEWVNRLGNLVLLSGRKNSKAQNYAFDKKKEIYKGKKATEFIITQEVTKYSIWNLTNLKKRHDELKDLVVQLFLN